MLETHIVCSCDKEFVNSTEIGYAFAIVTHKAKQLFYDLIAQIHCIIYKHKIIQTYETFK